MPTPPGHSPPFRRKGPPFGTIVLAIVLLVAAATAGVAWGGRHWRQQQLARLERGSTLVDTARGPIEVGESGSGRPVLVLHGTPGGFDQALAVTDVLASRNLRIIAPSRPGYLGTPLSVGATAEEQADAMAALLDSLDVPEAAVIGASGGGPVAIQLAVRHPERVSRLVLLEAVTAPLTLDTGNLTGGLMATDGGAMLLLGLVRRFPRLVFPVEVVRDEAMRGAALQLAATTFPLDVRREGILNDANQIGSMTGLPLQEVRAPSLLIHGTSDRNVPFEQSVVAAATMPSATLVSVADGTHDTTLFARQTVEAMRAFLLR